MTRWRRSTSRSRRPRLAPHGRRRGGCRRRRCGPARRGFAATPGHLPEAYWDFLAGLLRMPNAIAIILTFPWPLLGSSAPGLRSSTCRRTTCSRPRRKDSRLCGNAVRWPRLRLCSRRGTCWCYRSCGRVRRKKPSGSSSPTRLHGCTPRPCTTRLCARLPDVLPPRPACLTHGDLWANNILATKDGLPTVIDPAVSHAGRRRPGPLVVLSAPAGGEAVLRHLRGADRPGR